MRQDTFVTVCSFDPAIDKEATSVDAIVALARERDMSGVRFVPGVLPTLFTVREIPHQLWESFVENCSTDEERYRRAFMVGVVKVENVYQKDDVCVSVWTGSGTRKHRETQQHILDEDDLECFSPAERQEIGAAAYWHSFLPRRIKSGFQLPRSSLSTLRLADFHGAASNPTAQVTSSEKPSPATTEQPLDTTATTTAKGGTEFA